MLADAIAAERFRLSRDRTALFWGFGFAPLVSMLFSMGIDVFTRAVLHRTIPGETTDLANRAMGAVAGASGPFTALFLLIGAAAIFAGDYRWETWRLLTPRNSRVNLLAAKLIVFAEVAAWSLLLTAFTSVLAGLFGSVVNHAALVAPPNGSAFLGHFAGVFVITWLEVMLVGALAGLVGVVTRSTMGAVIAGLVVVFVQSTLAATMQATTWKSLAIPAYAGRILKGFVAAPDEVRPEAGPAGLALVLLLAWLIVLAAGAVALFRRQDLTKE
ncbi:ABC transporter permease [Caulobacter sp. BE254]|uniref:ABC transporter permease n=1 Tax=Caulobacter sp. BE254 TaxID=2817720 RepID=UPI002856E73F|nr:ABC transporter permease [Caulobacter sp. BE254]MDR7118872.1 ABC-2 type transport system permease protein [Caulobacter sp. BE254]